MGQDWDFKDLVFLTLSISRFQKLSKKKECKVKYLLNNFYLDYIYWFIMAY